MSSNAQKLIKLAVRNNVEWCELVCRSHNLPGKIEHNLWINAQKVPSYYPNIITLDKDINSEDQLQTINNVVSLRPGEWSIKDSFNTLDLDKIGFSKLFEAEWIVAPQNIHSNLKYKIISDIESLKAWEKAWNNNSVGIFKQELLSDNQVKFIAYYKEDKIIAGAILNKSAEIIGLSNLFCHTDSQAEFRLAFVKAAQTEFGNLPVVGYESGANLALAKSLGFESLGPLSVWIRN